MHQLLQQGLAALVLYCLANTVSGQTSASDSEAQVRAANADCFSCHSPQAVHKPPRADLDLSALAKFAHNPAPDTYQTSNHGKVACHQCHGRAYDAYPHPETARENRSDCAECHASKVMRIEQQFDASVHAVRLKDKFTCSSCHDPHRDLIAHRLVEPRRIVAQDNRHCLDCHDSDKAFAQFAPQEASGTAKPRPNIDRIHDWLPNTRLHWDAVRCVDCHTPATKTLSHEILSKDKAERQCLACHSANSTLKARLYRHLQKEENERLGFLNSIILTNAYVLGATRNPLLDSVIGGLFVLTLLGILIHATARLIGWLLRRRRNDE